MCGLGQLLVARTTFETGNTHMYWTDLLVIN